MGPTKIIVIKEKISLIYFIFHGICLNAQLTEGSIKVVFILFFLSFYWNIDPKLFDISCDLRLILKRKIYFYCFFLRNDLFFFICGNLHLRVIFFEIDESSTVPSNAQRIGTNVHFLCEGKSSDILTYLQDVPPGRDGCSPDGLYSLFHHVQWSVSFICTVPEFFPGLYRRPSCLHVFR